MSVVKQSGVVAGFQRVEGEKSEENLAEEEADQAEDKEEAEQNLAKYAVDQVFLHAS